MKSLGCILVFIICGLRLCADNDLFLEREYISGTGEKLPYRILYPENYNRNIRYPVLLFLHGAGERGNDNKQQLSYISDLLINPVVRIKYPAIVILPQCPLDSYWPFRKHPDKKCRWDRIVYPLHGRISKPLKLVEELLQMVIRQESVDLNRIYVTGLSMGGMGTYDIVIRNPRLFAAAVPICGGVNTGRLKKCALKVAFRIYHGDADEVVPVINSRKVYTELKRLGSEVEYIEYPGVNHGSWGNAFADPDFLSWLFSKRKFSMEKEYQH